MSQKIPDKLPTKKTFEYLLHQMKLKLLNIDTNLHNYLTPEKVQALIDDYTIRALSELNEDISCERKEEINNYTLYKLMIFATHITEAELQDIKVHKRSIQRPIDAGIFDIIKNQVNQLGIKFSKLTIGDKDFIENEIVNNILYDNMEGIEKVKFERIGPDSTEEIQINKFF